MTRHTENRGSGIRWPTLGICLLCHGGIIASTFWAADLGGVVALILLTLALTLYSSFNHEVLHGHPFRSEVANTALVLPAWGLAIPYLRFKDTHLQHHHDPALTDPYDDPESNYVDPVVWAQWSGLRRRVYGWNNTLLGRMAMGPLLSLLPFYLNDIRGMTGGDRRIVLAYLLHGLGLVPVIWWLATASTMPLWHYLLAVYLSLSILKIRTFLEHCAHEKARCRSVIIEDRGVLAFLFLNNNLHAVHHAHPGLPWYALWGTYRQRRGKFLRRNGGYAYRSYAQIARLFLLRAKDPVPHTLWPALAEPAPQAAPPAQTVPPGTLHP